MRCSILLASALATGAFALPQAVRTSFRILTETEVATVVVVVTVTGSAGQATATSSTTTVTSLRPVTLVSSSSLRTQSTIRTSSKTTTARTTTSSTSTRVTSSSTRASAIGPAAVSSSTRRTTSSSTKRTTSSSTRRTSSSSSRATSSSSRRPSSSSSTRAASPSIAAVSSSRASTSSIAPPVSTNAVSTPSSSTATPSASPSAAPANVGPVHVTGTQQANLVSGSDYQNAILYHHNAARANHGASPLTWDTACENNARIAAQTCNFAHYIPDGANQGQNLFTVSGTVFNVTAGITESWYKSEFPPMQPYFGQPSLPDAVFHNVGHLTQVLWKGTTGVGCVSLDCGANMKINGAASQLNKFTVCNYAPAGNIATLYADNVGFPLSTTNLGSWTD